MRLIRMLRDSGLPESGFVDLLRRFARAENGVAAVEFALVSVPFLALLFATLETALVFFAQQRLQTATTQAARLIMTGQAQAQGLSANQFQQAVCTDAGSLFNCAGIYVNVTNYNSFASVTLTSPISNGRFNSGAMGYNAGVSGDVEVVQVYYQWPVYAGALGFNLANLSGGLYLLTATAAFRNEPY